MSKEDAWLHLMAWIEKQERATFYISEGVWYIEWFNLKGGFQFVQGPTVLSLVEELKI